MFGLGEAHAACVRYSAWAAGPVADSEVDWEAESGPADDGRTVYTLLSRPLPPYALEHFFSRHGKV